MDPPSSPDSDPVSNLLSSTHLLGTDDTIKKMTQGVDDMDVDPILVVPDSPDRATKVQSSPDTGMDTTDHMRRQTRLKSFISGALDAEIEFRDSRPSNGSGKNAETVVLSSGNHFMDARNSRLAGRCVDTEHMLRQAKLKGFISIDEKPSLEVPYAKTGFGRGKNVETVACTSPFADAWLSQIGNSRSKSRVALERESSDSSSCAEVLAPLSSLSNRLVDMTGANSGGFFDSKDAELGQKDKVRKIDTGSKMGQRFLAHNIRLAPCSTRKANARPKIDSQVTAENADGEPLSFFDRSDQDRKGLGVHCLFESKDGENADGEPLSFFDRSDQDRKGLGVHCLFESKDGEAPPRRIRDNSSRSRQGHNGCTNTAWDSSLREEGVRKTFDDHQHEGTIDLDPEVSHNRNKGKAKLDESPVGDTQHVKLEIQPERLCLTGRNRPVVADVDDDTFKSFEDAGWRTARNRTKKMPDSLLEIADYFRDYNKDSSEQGHYIPVQDRTSVNIVGDSSEATVLHHESNPTLTHVTSASERKSRRHRRRQKLAKENRKCRSLLSVVGGSSTSAFENLEYPYSQPFLPYFSSKFNKTANSQRHRTTSRPVIEVSELHSPGIRHSSLQEQNLRVHDSSARERQVESDEVLARQLQEQFFHESAAFGDDETDATIAYSLQEMEDAQQATSITRHNRPHAREMSIAHLCAQFPQLSYQNVSAEATSSAPGRTIRREIQFRRNLNNPVADRESMPNFLEAMEAAFDDSTDMAMPSNFLQIGHDFNENDYEMLLSLDYNNHNAGVSQSQINNLPQSVIQNNNIEEACVVCLEAPVKGDVIRHLPCLHKFHKECIDKWLRRRASCPICKSSITQE